MLSAATRLRLAVAALVVAASLTWLACLGAAPALDPGPAVVVTLLGLLAGYPLVRVRVGASDLAVNWTEFAAVVALVAVAPPLAVVLLGPAFALSQLLLRDPTVKAVTNGAVMTLSTGAAALVAGQLGAQPRLDSGQALLVLGAAVVAHSVVSTLLTGAVVAVAHGTPLHRVVRAGWWANMLVVLANAGLGLGVAVLLAAVPDSLYVVPLVAVVLVLAHGSLLRARQERDAWRSLELATRDLARLEEPEVVEAALRRARGLFACDAVELQLSAVGDRPARLLRLADGGVEELQGAGTAAAGTLVALTADGHAPVATSVAACLDGPQGPLGVLRLVFGGTTRLSPREHQVLRTFAHAVAATLQNARLHEDVRAEAARNAHAAQHDALTGLPNRVLLHEAVTRALAEPDGSTTALLLLDLDHFKQINDTLGHDAGDALLQQVAARLTTTVGADGLVARLGGDEFAVLLTGLWSPRRAEAVAARLLAALALPAEVDGLRLAAEASLGLACHPQDADSTAEMFRRADVAMYQAKSTRGAWLRYDEGRDDSSVHRLSLVSELRQALERDEVVVHFQPQLDLRTGAVVSAEALCRWEHPERGMLLPGEFIPVVEQSGLVRPFTLRVLELALRASAQWNAGDGPRVRVAVNLAARSLLDVALPDDVALLLVRTGARAADLVLEITETTATSELEVVEEVLARLRHAGVEISVDDFGTGYSSLAFLQRSGVDELKVDQGFVRGMLTSDSDAALVRATVQLAHSLGARAVAEGVEDAAHAQALRELGCDLAQGWHYGAAEPVGVLTARLAGGPAVLGPRVVRLHA